MARGFETARRTGTTVPRVQSTKWKTAQTFTSRALVYLDVNSELNECAANPTQVFGVALEGVGGRPGYDLPNSTYFTNVVTGAVQEVSVAIADSEQEFSARMVNGATDPVTPLQTDIGAQYGVAKSGSEWYVNQADTVNVVVVVTDIRTDDNVVLVKFLKAVQQANP